MPIFVLARGEVEDKEIAEEIKEKLEKEGFKVSFYRP